MFGLNLPSGHKPNSPQLIPNTLTEQLTAYWGMAENGGNTVKNLAKSSNRLTLDEFATANGQSWGLSAFGPGVIYGTVGSQSATIQDLSLLGAANISRTIWLEVLWRTVPVGAVSVFTLANSGGTAAGIQIGASTPGPFLDSNLFGGTGQIVGPTIVANMLNSVAVTVDNAGTRRLFVNGVSYGSDATVIGSGALDSGFIGTYDGSSEAMDNAYVRQAAIWNRALTPTEIMRLFEAPFNSFTKLSWWKFGSTTPATSFPFNVISPIISHLVR